MSEVLPKGWVKVTFGGLFDFKGGSQPPKSEFISQPKEGYIRLLQIRDFESDEKAVYIRHHDKWPKCETYDIMIGRYGASVGKILGGKAGAYNVALVKMIFDQDNISSGWVKYYLKSDWFQLPLAKISRSAQNGFNKADLDPLDVHLPPLPEQKRIVDKIDSLGAKLKRAKDHLIHIPKLVEKYKQAILEKAFNGYLYNPIDKWPSPLELRTFVEKFSYGTSAKSNKQGAVPVLRMGNIQDGKLDWNNLVYTSDTAEITKYELNIGDVLFNRTNSPELVGKTALFSGERPAIYAGYLIKIKCKKELNPRYLTYYLNSPIGREYCWRVKSDGVSQSNINAQKLGDFEVSVPDVMIQEEIVRRIEAAFNWIDRLAKEATSARKLIDTLDKAILSKAFRGELVPQDPNDEPASVLLERIRNESQPTAKKRKA